MKKNLVLLIALSLAATFINYAQAQYRVSENDGIAASPKVRQMLNESKASMTMLPASRPVAVQQASIDGTAASPKVNQMLAEQKANQSAAKIVVSPAPVRSAESGIAASPRVQKELNERTTPAVQIAPLK
jgi:hypothetical protein